MAEAIRPEVEHFVQEHLETFEQLEVLLLLYRETRTWTPAEVAELLKVPTATTDMALGHLVAHAIVAHSSDAARGYRYAPASQATVLLVQELAVAHLENRMALMNLMTSQAIDRVRRAALRTFSEAFRLRGPGNA